MFKVKNGNKFLLIILLVNIFGSEALSLVVSISSSLRNLLAGSGSAGILGLLAFTQIVLIGIPCLIYLMIKGNKGRDIVRLNPITNIDAISTFFIALLLTPFLMVLSAISNIFSQNTVGEVIGEISTMPLYIMLIGVAILPSIFEELVMRGIILSEYRHVSIKKAAIMNGLLFCIFHLNLQQSIYTFAMGVLMALFVIYTNSIIPAMIFHFTVNGLNVLLSKIALGATDYAQESTASMQEPTLIQNIISYGILVLIVVACTYRAAIMIKNFKKRNMDYINSRSLYIEDSKKSQSIVDIYLILSIIIYFVYTILLTGQLM